MDMSDVFHSSQVSGGRGVTGMLRIPAGRFVMGGCGEDKFVSGVELPAREVEIERDFLIAEAPVTRRQWTEVMGGLPPGNLPWLEDSVPVVCVTFADTQAFCQKLGNNSRLPCEAEWEYACRGGGNEVFPGGPNVSTAEANYLYNELGDQIGLGKLVPVCSYQRNGFGLADMIGNVCEWVTDAWHAGYHGAPGRAIPWTAGGKPGYRVMRGGGWDHLPRVLRSSWRDWAPEGARWDNLGFRVARDF